MSKPKIEPHKITKPVQRMAVWFAGLILLESILITGACAIRVPTWVSGFLSISGVVLVPIFLTMVFMMQTRFRPQLQEDSFYYEEQKGLFLVHTWRPSRTPGQIADIIIWVHQHGDGPKTEGLIERIEYSLGPKFFSAPIVKTNAADAFRMEISAYGPVLCLARAYLIGETRPIELERYINFETDFRPADRDASGLEEVL